MGILIGMDEAGYGPSLGPLVVAATAWEVPEEGSGFGVQGSDGEDAAARLSSPKSGVGDSCGGTATAVRQKRKQHQDCVDLYTVLRNVIAKSSSERRIAIADSKLLYHPGLGLRQLERGVHSVLQTIGHSLPCWSAMVRHCDADPDCHHVRVCWPDGFDCGLPVDAAAEELARLGARLMRACESAGVRPLAIRAKLVFPEQFNNLVAHYNSKGEALSHVTVGLLRELMGQLCPPAESSFSKEPPVPSPQPPIHAVCDKHGGRNYYAALLQHHFSEHWIAPVYETHAESRYEWGPPERRVRVIFRMNGERFLPTALASMTAKYLRELAMRAFNAFWAAQGPNLRPTAGYSVDARRFKQDIAAKQRELGIDDHLMWRNR